MKWFLMMQTQEQKPKNKNGSTMFNIVKQLSSKAIFLLVNLQLILISKFCLFSTILNLIPYLFLIISVFIGITIKRYLDRLLGVKNNLIIALCLFSIGSILFLLSPFLIIFIGIPIGILINHQIQNFSNLFNPKSTRKRDFIYIFVIAAAIVMLCPTELYDTALFFSTIASIIFSTIGVYHTIE